MPEPLRKAFLAAIFLAWVLVPLTDVQSQPRGAPVTNDLLKRIGLSRATDSSWAPDFSLDDVNGGAVSLSSYRGKVVFLNFWATWCGPCRDEMPSMERLHRQLGSRGLAMLAVNAKESRQQVANFMKAHGLSFPALLDPNGRVSALYKVWGLPATFLIDADGRTIGMKSGAKDWGAHDVVSVLKILIGEGENPPGMRGADFGPTEPLPVVLRAKFPESLVHAQQDVRSEIVTKLAQGDELSPLGKASGAGEVWYMIKTKTGAMGWIRRVDVEEAKKPK